MDVGPADRRQSDSHDGFARTGYGNRLLFQSEFPGAAKHVSFHESSCERVNVALLKRHPNPTDADIDAEVTNACRCSTYHRIRQAIHLAARKVAAGGKI